MVTSLSSGHHHHWHLPSPKRETEVLFGRPASTTIRPCAQTRMGRLAGCLHQTHTTCHFNGSLPPPLSLQTVRWRGIQKIVGIVYRVDEQCGVAGALRCVNFMFSFCLFTHPPTPKYTPNEREDLRRPPAPACPSPKQVEGYSITGPAHPITVAPLNKRRGLCCPPIPISTSSTLQTSARGLHHPSPSLLSI